MEDLLEEGLDLNHLTPMQTLNVGKYHYNQFKEIVFATRHPNLDKLNALMNKVKEEGRETMTPMEVAEFDVQIGATTVLIGLN